MSIRKFLSYFYIMNIVERYIYCKKGLIILISGLSGSDRSRLAKEIERDFKIKLLSLEKYCTNDPPIIEFSEHKLKNWDDIEVYDWNKFNDDVKKFKKRWMRDLW